MKREVRLLRRRALDSLVLAVEHFNRPSNLGRPEAVLINLDRSFEMLLKSMIVHRGGRIRERRANQTIGFDHCVRKCLSDASVVCLTREQALTLQIINGQRDAAQHYLLEISEHGLYLLTQAGVTLFRDLFKTVFDEELGSFLPERVLPVCTVLPKDIVDLLRDEVAEIRRLLRPRSRKKLEAKARVRAFAIMEASVNGQTAQPSNSDLNRVLRRIADGESWDEVFPGVAQLRLNTEGSGLTYSIRITKAEGIPIHLVREGEPGAAVVAVRRVNELDYYSLGLKPLAERLNLTPPMTLALVRYLTLQDDEEYFKEIRIGTSRFKRYSAKALERITEELPGLDLAEVWRTCRPGIPMPTH